MNSDPRYVETGKILRNMDGYLPVKLYKTTRAGATTGLTANCLDTGDTVLLIAPTKNIAHITIKESKEYSQHTDANIKLLLSNHDCILNKIMVKDNPDVGEIPILPLPKNCIKCKYFLECPVTDLIRSDKKDVDGIGITYQKLKAIMFSDSETADMIKGRLIDCGVIIFDEAHEFESPDVISLQVYPHRSLEPYRLLFKDNKKISPFLEKYAQIVHDKEVSIMELVSMHDDAEKNLMMTELKDVESKLGFKNVVKAIKEIIDIMKNRNDYGLSIEEVLYIFKIVMLFAADKYVLHYIKNDAGGTVYLSTTDSLVPALRIFRSMLDPSRKRKVIFTTATFGDLDYTGIFGFHDNVMMPDVMQTNGRITIYPDTFRMDNINYSKKHWKRIVDAAEKYEKKYPGIVFICMTRRIKWWLEHRMAERGYDINADYYRSTNMIGVSSDERRCVCVGEPVMPINTYDGVSTTYMESQKRRVGNNQAAWWQAISRFKSPSGTQDTYIYCIGITEKSVRMMVKWGANRKLSLRGTKCDGVEVDEAFDEPNIVSNVSEKLLKIVKSKGTVDRTYLMRYLHIKAAKLDELLAQEDIAKHITIVKRKTSRKPKTSYKWVE